MAGHPLRDRPRGLVKGMLGIGECSVCYGASGTGKSFFALDLGLHVAWGASGSAGRSAALVIYIAAEASGQRTAARHRLRQHHGIAGEDVPFALITSPINLLEATPDLPALIHEIEDAKATLPTCRS